MCYSLNHCLGLFCYHPAALENNTNPVFCFLFFWCKLLAVSAFAPGQIFLCPWLRGSAFQTQGRIQKNTCATASSQSTSDGPHHWKRGQISGPANCRPICAVEYKPTRLKCLQIYSSGFSDLNTSLKLTWHQALHFTQNYVKVSV